VAQQLAPALGVVQSVFHDQDYSCTVTLRESGVVLPKVPIATGLIGSVALPAERDLVVIVFLGGDIHAPVVVGRLYNEQIAPPEHQPGNLVAVLPGGEKDTNKNFQLKVATPGDSRSLLITLDGSVKMEIEINDSGIRFQAQDTKLTLEQSSSSDGKATLAVGESTITVEQAGDITIQAKGTLKLKASQIEITSDSTVKVAGQTVNLN